MDPETSITCAFRNEPATKRMVVDLLSGHCQSRGSLAGELFNEKELNAEKYTTVEFSRGNSRRTAYLQFGASKSR